MGWDIVEGKAIDGQDLPKDLYAIRFAKCLKSMQCFDEADLYNNALKFLQESKNIDKILGSNNYVASSLFSYEKSVEYARGDVLYTKKVDGAIDGFSIFKENQYKFGKIIGNEFIAPASIPTISISAKAIESIISPPESSIISTPSSPRIDPISVPSIPLFSSSLLTAPSTSVLASEIIIPISVEVIKNSASAIENVPSIAASVNLRSISKIAPSISASRLRLESRVPISAIDLVPGTIITKPIVYNPVYKKYINTKEILEYHKNIVDVKEGVNSARGRVEVKLAILLQCGLSMENIFDDAFSDNIRNRINKNEIPSLLFELGFSKEEIEKSKDSFQGGISINKADVAVLLYDREIPDYDQARVDFYNLANLLLQKNIRDEVYLKYFHNIYDRIKERKEVLADAVDERGVMDIINRTLISK